LDDVCAIHVLFGWGVTVVYFVFGARVFGVRPAPQCTVLIPREQLLCFVHAQEQVYRCACTSQSLLCTPTSTHQHPPNRTHTSIHPTAPTPAYTKSHSSTQRTVHCIDLIRRLCVALYFGAFWCILVHFGAIEALPAIVQPPHMRNPPQPINNVRASLRDGTYQSCHVTSRHVTSRLTRFSGTWSRTITAHSPFRTCIEHTLSTRHSTTTTTARREAGRGSRRPNRG
jgi:hypothetical protein